MKGGVCCEFRLYSIDLDWHVVRKPRLQVMLNVVTADMCTKRVAKMLASRLRFTERRPLPWPFPVTHVFFLGRAPVDFNHDGCVVFCRRRTTVVHSVVVGAHRRTSTAHRQRSTAHRRTSTAHIQTLTAHRRTSTAHRRTPTTHSETSTAHRQTSTAHRRTPTAHRR